MHLIDTHVHLGRSKFTGVESTEADLLRSMDANGVAASLVMPQPTLEPIPDVHRRIDELCRRHPGRFYGMAAIDPWLDDETFADQARDCFERYRFRAIKLHPLGHNISPLSPRCDNIYEAARRYGVPVLVHTGLGNPFSLPSLMIDPAVRYPDVTFILSHAGFAVYTDEAIIAARHCPNIMLEPSWCPTYAIRKMADTIGADRLLFGSDHISNLPVEIVKYYSCGLTDDELRRIFHDNANALFKLQ